MDLCSPRVRVPGVVASGLRKAETPVVGESFWKKSSMDGEVPDSRELACKRDVSSVKWLAKLVAVPLGFAFAGRCFGGDEVLEPPLGFSFQALA